MGRIAIAAAGLMLACVGLGGLAGCNGASSKAVNRIGQDGNKGFMVKTVKRGIWTREYGLFVPMSYRPGVSQKYPVIVFLHGIGEGAGLGEGDRKNMTVGLAPRVAEKADRFDFIVIFPQSGGTWGPDSEYASDIFAALDQVSREYPVDQERIILTGLSTGGAGTWAIGAKYHDRFAAIVPMASNGADPGRDAANLTDMPVRAYCSWAGDVFAGWNDQSMVNEIKKLNPNADVKFTATSTFGHDCWEEVYAKDDIFNWMRQQRRGGGVAKASPAAPVHSAVAVVDAIKPASGKGVVVSSTGPVSAPQQRAVAPTPVRVQEQRTVASPVAAAPKVAAPSTAAPRTVAPVSVAPRVVAQRPATPIITPPAPVAPRAATPASASASDGRAWVNTPW